MQLFRIIFLLAKLQNKKETAKQFPNFISTSAANFEGARCENSNSLSPALIPEQARLPVAFPKGKGARKRTKHISHLAPTTG